MKKLVSLFLVLVLFLTMAVTTSALAEPEELTIWGPWSGTRASQLQILIDKFNESQDKYHVSYVTTSNIQDKLLIALAGGDAPDLVQWDRFYTSTYAPKGALVALDDLAARDNVDLNSFYEVGQRELTCNGKTYGITLSVDVRVYMYNKDLLEASGVDPSTITNLDTLMEAAKQCTIRDENGNLVQTGFNFNNLFVTYIRMFDNHGVVDDSGEIPVMNVNNDAGLAVLNYYHRWLYDDKVYDLGFDDSYSGDSFAAGKSVFTVNTNYKMNKYIDENGINVGVLPPLQPMTDTGAFACMIGGYSFAIPAASKNVEGAWEFIKWWSTSVENSVEYGKISGYLPGLKEAWNDEAFMAQDNMKIVLDYLPYGYCRDTVLGYSEMESKALAAYTQLFISGEITAEEALRQAEELGNQILADAAEEY